MSVGICIHIHIFAREQATNPPSAEHRGRSSSSARWSKMVLLEPSIIGNDDTGGNSDNESIHCEVQRCMNSKFPCAGTRMCFPKSDRSRWVGGGSVRPFCRIEMRYGVA